MNENDFWRTFFQSDYYKIDRMSSSNAHGLFSDCAAHDDKGKISNH